MPNEIKVNGSKIRLEKGDITDMEVDAFVYYARSDLDLGSGFGGAIAVRGGPSVNEQLKLIKDEVPVGEAVITDAGEMKAKKIIHAVGPKFQEENTKSKLEKTMQSALSKAVEAGVDSVAFPPMGYGFYGVPIDMCADVMIDSIKSYLSNNKELKEVIIVPGDSKQYAPFEARLK